MNGGLKQAANAAFNFTKNILKSKLNIVLLKYRLIIGGAIIAIGILTILLIGIISTVSNVAMNSSQNNNQSLVLNPTQLEVSAEVMQYKNDILRELKKYKKEIYVDVLLALMMQESGGRGNDPMQASESKCGYIGCITSPKESIQYGVKHFLDVLELANEDISLTLQSYNFGSGFIGYVNARGGVYTYELAITFSQMMYDILKDYGIYRCHRAEAIEYNACYGDILYVQSVLRYLSPASQLAVGLIPNDSELTVMSINLQIVLNEIKKYHGFPYVFGGASPQTSFDCSGLMQWAFKQAGVNLPRTAEQQYYSSTIVSASEARPGDLVFFANTYKKGVSHVGIYLGNGKMYDTSSNPTGVGIKDITSGYWKQKFYAYGRVVEFK